MGLPTNKNRRRFRSSHVRLDHDTGAYIEGVEAKCWSHPITANPYPRGSLKHREWSRGWRKTK